MGALPLKEREVHMRELPKLDNLDRRIRYVHLMFERDTRQLPHFEIPRGYEFRYFQDGDRDDWIAIEWSAGEFHSYEEGREAWTRFYEGHEEELGSRMFFIVNQAGEKVATATAYYDVTGVPEPGVGRLHWVAVKREHQGRGLARPLISRALERLKELGFERVKLSTQTTTWVACRLYMDFGFHPEPQNVQESPEGWRILKRLTNHPVLEEFPIAEEEELWAKEGIISC